VKQIFFLLLVNMASMEGREKSLTNFVLMNMKMLQ
jgi:hypothetical protein